MDLTLTSWPAVDRLIWTAATVAIAYAFGLLVNAIVIRRLQKLAARTSGEWDDAVVLELRKRIPLWSLLGGLWLSIGYWPLHERWAFLISSLIAGIIVLSVTLAAAAIAVRLVGDLAPKVNPDVQVSGLMRNVVRFGILSVGILIILRGFGVEITPVLAALGVGGLAVALALQEPLSNLFAGLFITLAGQMRIGDYIRMENGPEGTVADFGWHATHLHARAGNLIVVPNAKLAQAIVTNFDRPARDLGLGVEVTVDVESDLAEVERLALMAASSVMREVAGGVPAAEVSVRFAAFSDLGVRCSVNVRSREVGDQFLVRHELVKRLQAAFNDAGIRLATVNRSEVRRQKSEESS